MSIKESVPLILSAGFFALCAVSGINALKKKYSHEIYLIWYITSFFFIVFLALEIIAGLNGITLTGVCGPYESTCKMIHDYLTDFGGEFELVAGFLILTIAPQLLAYVLSGLSGSASPPLFVSQITKLATWSFVKFSAGYAGILLATPVAQLCLGRPVNAAPIAMAIFQIGIAFTYPMFALGLFFSGPPEAIRNGMVIPFVSRCVAKFHKFCTRNVSTD